LFETIHADDAATRLRNAAIVPLAAFLFAQIYSTLTPFLSRVPPWLFWSVTVVVLAGAVIGALLIVRIVRRESIRGRAVAWLIAAIVLDLICLRLWLKMVFPWI
jgi:hypothetical protein